MNCPGTLEAWAGGDPGRKLAITGQVERVGMYLAFNKTLQKGDELSEPQCLKGHEEF